MKQMILLSLLSSINFSFAQKEEETILLNVEGFYSFGWEYSNFKQVDLDKCLFYNDHWATFLSNVKLNGKPYNFSEETNRNEVYMRVNAIQKTGKNYGHLGSSKSEILITEILEIDTTKTFDACLKQYGYFKIIKN